MKQAGKTDKPDSDKTDTVTDTTPSGQTDSPHIQSRSDRVEVGSRRNRARKFKSHKRQSSEKNEVTW